MKLSGKKRFSRWQLLLLALCALIALVPALRNVAHIQLAGSDVVAFSVWPRKTHWRYHIAPSRWKALVKKHPRDIYLTIQSVETRFIGEDDEDGDYYSYAAPPIPIAPGTNRPLNNEYQLRHLTLRKSYDAILQRFPRHALEPWLLSRRLDYTLKWMSPRRTAGELSPYNPADDTDQRYSRENFSRRDVDAAIALARRGQKLEPDNAFFDWALCKFLLIARRDNEADTVLSKAIRKTRYGHHENDGKRAVLKAHEIALQRPLLYEEKVRILSKSLRSDYDYYGSPEDNFEKEALSILAWKSLRAAQRGDHKAALQWAEYALRVAQWEREIASFSTRANKASAEINLQNDLARDLMIKKSTPGNPLRGRYRRGAVSQQTFENYAVQHGRPDVARLAKRNAATANTINTTAMTQREYALSGLYGMAPIPLGLLTICWVFGTLLLFSLLGTFLGLVLLTLFLRLRRVRAFLHTDNGSEPKTGFIARREVLGGMLACSGLRAIGSAIAACIVGGALALCITLAVVTQDDIVRFWNDLNTAIAAPSFWPDLHLAWRDIWSGIGTALNTYDELPHFFHFVMPFLPVLLGVFYAQWRGVHFQRLRNGEGSDPRFWPFVRDVATGRFFRDGYDFDFSRAVLKLFDWLMFLACLVSWFVLAFWYEEEYWWLAIFAIALGLTFFVMLGNFIRWRRRPFRRAAARYNLQLLQASLRGWLATALIAYFLLLLLSVPIRHRAEQRLEQVLRYGEVRAARMQ